MLAKIPNGQQELFDIFGNALLKEGFEREYIISIPISYTLYYEGNPVNKIRCHKLAADHFLAAFNNLIERGLQHEIQEYNGIYNYRPMRGKQTTLSVHAFGAAIDVEASKYPFRSRKRMPESVIKCFTDVGFTYGGNFKSDLRKDPMHFQLATNY